MTRMKFSKKEEGRGEKESLKRGILTKVSLFNPEPLEKSLGNFLKEMN